MGARAQTARAWNACHVGILVIDGHHALSNGQGLTRLELSLASTVLSEGRPLIVAINKLDTLAEGARPQACIHCFEVKFSVLWCCVHSEIVCILRLLESDGW